MVHKDLPAEISEAISKIKNYCEEHYNCSNCSLSIDDGLCYCSLTFNSPHDWSTSEK